MHTSDHAYLYVSLGMGRRTGGEPSGPRVKSKVKVTRVNRKKVVGELKNMKDQSEEGWWKDLARMAREYRLSVRAES